MAVYRDRKRARPILFVGLGALAIGALILVGALIFFRPVPPPTDPLAEAKARALEAAQGLEVFSIEYPQAAQGAELAGALGALTRAQTAFETMQSDLAQIDAAAVEDIAADFTTLKEKVDARAPTEEVLPLADAVRKKLLALATGQSP